MNPSDSNKAPFLNALKIVFKLTRKYWYISIILILVAVTGLIVLVLPFVLPKSIKSGDVSGIIFNNQVWTGDIRVVGDTIALPGTTIEVKPGTRIFISKNGDKSNFFILPWFTKFGINTGIHDRGVDKGEPFWDEREKVQLRLDNIHAIGTKDAPITISSNSHPGSRYDINLITFNRGEIEYTELSNYRQLEIGEHFRITNSKFSHTGDCAICLQFGTQTIKENEFREGLKYYIKVSQGAPKIDGNKFLTSDGDGVIFFGNKDSNIILRNNFFDMPSKVAVKISAVDEGGVISGNFFNGGNIELPCNNRADIVGNSIKVQIIFKDTYNNCLGEYLFGSNYWEILDSEAIINARIVGNTERYRVRIPDFLKTAPATSSASPD